SCSCHKCWGSWRRCAWILVQGNLLGREERERENKDGGRTEVTHRAEEKKRSSPHQFKTRNHQI
uniref:Uncharacterized protein n=1 Tax=Amphimedon queenslandica TaxID=400682 RepID=A0A1X7VA00_AMPQE